MPEEWITIQDACNISGYNAEYIRRMIRNGKLKAKKVSIVWIVEKQSLLDYISQTQERSDRRCGPKRRQPS